MPDATLRDRIIAAVGAAAKHGGIGVSGDGTVSMTTSGWNALHAGLDVVLDTALADAVACARREALEEAATEIEPAGPRPCDCERWCCGCGNPGDTAAVVDWDSQQDAASAIRALAANPPETRQTETGDAR